MYDPEFLDNAPYQLGTGISNRLTAAQERFGLKRISTLSVQGAEIDTDGWDIPTVDDDGWDIPA